MKVIVPVLTLTKADGTIDKSATQRYAHLIEDASNYTAIINGSLGRGDFLTLEQRVINATIWREEIPAARRLVCAWTAEETMHEECMVVPLPREWTVSQLAQLTSGHIVYSHPRFTEHIIAPQDVTALIAEKPRPCGFKLSKCSYETLEQISEAGHDTFKLWHGTARDLARSRRCGAEAVVASCLAATPVHITSGSLQEIIDTRLAVLDRISGRDARIGFLEAQLRTLISLH